MAQWPPSPVVEDEATALSKECLWGATNQSPAIGDHSVPSRGSVDQYPIIADTIPLPHAATPSVPPKPTPTDSLHSQTQPRQPHASLEPREQHASQPYPASHTEPRGRDFHPDPKPDPVHASSTSRSHSAARFDDVTQSRSRPTISRGQTDVVGEIQRMQAGTRRDPSPYSYTRDSNTLRLDPGKKSTTDHFLSPTHASESPISTQPPPVHSDEYKDFRDYDSSTDSDRKPKKTLRFADKPMGPAHPSRPRKSFSLPESRSHEDEVHTTIMAQPSVDSVSSHRRHHHREGAEDTGTDVDSRVYRSKTRASTSSSQVRESPYSSAAEDPRLNEPSRIAREPAHGEQSIQQRLSHRRERPRLSEPLSFFPDPGKADASDDDSRRRVYHIRDPRSPMTPPSVSTPNNMEEYFTKAFDENAIRHSKYTPRSSVEDTAIFSPPTSPPRTPRSERPSRREYFESPSSSPQRTPRGSRPPSLEESQIRDLKTHHSLLSQATAGAAAVAAKISPPATRSPSTIDATLGNPNHVIVTKTRSRASSPAKDNGKQSNRVDPSAYVQPRSRASSPQRESNKPIIHRADPVGYIPPRPRESSPYREVFRPAARADTMGYVQPRSRASSPQREMLKPVVHRADSASYGQSRIRATSPLREPVRQTVRGDSLPYDKPRLQASSPQSEMPRLVLRADTWTSADPGVRVFYPGPPQVKRPSTRDGLPQFDLPSQPPVAQPKRTSSFTGHDHQYRLREPHHHGPLHNMTVVDSASPSVSLNVPPPLVRASSASMSTEVPRQSEDFILPSCPRPNPTQGLRDWSTIRGIPNLDVCPKCAHTLRTTQYHSLVTRSSDKPYDRITICAMSRPWVRIAVAQCVKRNKTNLSLIKQANTVALGSRPCPGIAVDVRTWWRVPDSLTDRSVPNFLACSACIGSIHAVYPELEQAFVQDDLNHEGVCSLRSTNADFPMFAEKVAQIAEKCRDRDKCKPKYVQPLVEAIKRASVRYNHVACARGRMISGRPWHYIDSLPEFTVCEACFEEVVWPVRDMPHVRDMSRTTKIVPASAYKGSNTAAAASGGMHPISCQLYSDRMRNMFDDLIAGRISWDFFQRKVRYRQEAQYKLLEENRRFEDDQNMGYDRRRLLENNRAYWGHLE